MAIKKKYLQKQDLTSIETFTIDNRTESIYFNVIDLEEIVSDYSLQIRKNSIIPDCDREKLENFTKDL